jgi:type VI secretion system protein ImpH
MRLHDFYRMLPVGDAFCRLKCWVLNYSGQEYFWDVQLVLKAEDVPDTRLGKEGLLGWTTWLKSKPFEREADDLVINGG